MCQERCHLRALHLVLPLPGPLSLRYSQGITFCWRTAQSLAILSFFDYILPLTFFIHASPSELPWVTLSYSYFEFQAQWFWWIKSLWQRSRWSLAMLSLRKQITPWWDHLTIKQKQLPHDRNWSCSPYMGTISSWWEWNRPSSNEDFPGALQSRSWDNNQQDHDLTKTTCSASFATSTYADPQLCLCSPFL